MKVSTTERGNVSLIWLKNMGARIEAPIIFPLKRKRVDHNDFRPNSMKFNVSPISYEIETIEELQ